MIAQSSSSTSLLRAEVFVPSIHHLRLNQLKMLDIGGVIVNLDGAEKVKVGANVGVSASFDTSAWAACGFPFPLIIVSGQKLDY